MVRLVLEKHTDKGGYVHQQNINAQGTSTTKLAGNL
jgi:hypothetical protein